MNTFFGLFLLAIVFFLVVLGIVVVLSEIEDML
jgi:hypothetical protein